MDFGSLLEGQLVKSDPSFKSWKKRWFVLQDNLLYYFEKKSKNKPLGTILFSKIRDVCVADPSVVSKPNSLWLVCDDRTYTLSLPTQDLVHEWMSTINVLMKLHNSRNDYKDKTGFADKYKHFLITNCKKALNESTKLTGITKALVGKRGDKSKIESISADIFNDNERLGRAAIRAGECVLEAMEDVFDPVKLDQLCGALEEWKNVGLHLVTYTAETPNLYAAEATANFLAQACDGIIVEDRPSPLVEISGALETLVDTLNRYYFANTTDERQSRRKELRTVSNLFLVSANYVANAVPTEERNQIQKIASRIPDDAVQVMDDIKNAAFFTDDEHQQKAVISKERIRNTMQELCVAYENIWGSSIRKPSVVNEIGPSSAADVSMETVDFGGEMIDEV